jgi:SAM-dependent MidA family methyltransferase
MAYGRDSRSAEVEHDSPDPAAALVSDRLAELIRQEADSRGGLLPFDRFMELALYAPGLGYYVAGARKLGREGDFVTAPEISPLFGRCLAEQCREVLQQMDEGAVLELGAGSGALAVEVLCGLRALGVLPARYLILEVSPELRDRQGRLFAERIPELAGRVQWLERLPESFEGVVLANEVVDAMPVHRFRIGADGSPQEIFVRATQEGWEEVAGPVASPGLAEAVRGLRADGLALDPGYSSEVNLRMAPWLGALGAHMERGLVLAIDYGYPRREYYQPSRRAGTLMCYHRQEACEDPFRRIGLQDITAHVDFSALAAGGQAAGFTLEGFTTQAHFLLGCGVERLLAEAAAGGGGSVDLLLGAKQLLLPSAMGERIRVLGLGKEMTGPWCGFSVRDLRDRL